MIKVTAKCTIKKDSVETFKTVISQIVDGARTENGCIAYELFQDLKDDTVFMLIEAWENAENLEAHAKAGENNELVAQMFATFEKEMEFNTFTLIK